MSVEKKIFTPKSGIPSVGFYENELNKKDFTFIITNDSKFEGKIYKVYPEIIKANYELKEFEHNGRIHQKYEISIADIIEVIEEKEDNPISLMTIRDFYSIIRNKPESTKEWLNELIKKY